VQNNLERWYAQMKQPDGRPSKDVAVITNRTVDGLKITVVDLPGTYVPQLGPMPRNSKPGYRLLGAIVEADGEPWFSRPRGPAAGFFSEIVKLLLMFFAGLEIDIDQFTRTRSRSMAFGALTFALPLLVGIGVGRAFDYAWVAALLIGSLLASHTLLGFPIVQR